MIPISALIATTWSWLKLKTQPRAHCLWVMKIVRSPLMIRPFMIKLYKMGQPLSPNRLKLDQEPSMSMFRQEPLMFPFITTIKSIHTHFKPTMVFHINPIPLRRDKITLSLFWSTSQAFLCLAIILLKWNPSHRNNKSIIKTLRRASPPASTS